VDGAKMPTVTTLARIEPHQLRALILEVLARYPGSASSEINGRVGPKLSVKTIKRALDGLVDVAPAVGARDGRLGVRHRPTPAARRMHARRA
jgi:hypothetical protein